VYRLSEFSCIIIVSIKIDTPGRKAIRDDGPEYKEGGVRSSLFVLSKQQNQPNNVKYSCLLNNKNRKFTSDPKHTLTFLSLNFLKSNISLENGLLYFCFDSLTTQTQITFHSFFDHFLAIFDSVLPVYFFLPSTQIINAL